MKIYNTRVQSFLAIGRYASFKLWRTPLVILSILLTSVALSGCAGLAGTANSTGNPPSSPLHTTNVRVGSTTTGTSQIVWTTDVAADSAADFGTTTSYGSSTPVSSAMVTNHQVTLSGLAAGTTY